MGRTELVSGEHTAQLHPAGTATTYKAPKPLAAMHPMPNYTHAALRPIWAVQALGCALGSSLTPTAVMGH